MIDLTKAVLPEAIAVRGRYYRIHTDFKYMLMFHRLLQQETPPTHEDITFLFIDDIESAFHFDALDALVRFMNPPRELPRKVTSEKERLIVLDYEADADLIYAAFMQQYGIDLITERLHWYVFCALLEGLKDTKLNDIISFRLWKPEGGKKTAYDTQMQKLYEAWRIRQPVKEDTALKAFEAQLKG